MYIYTHAVEWNAWSSFSTHSALTAYPHDLNGIQIQLVIRIHRWDSKGGDKGDTDKVSPWEIMPVAEEAVPPALSSNLSDTECKRLESALAESVVVTDVARPFVAQLPEGMLAYVPLPLNLELVIARLRNGYYRSEFRVSAKWVETIGVNVTLCVVCLWKCGCWE